VTPDTADLILSELRELRSVVNEARERLASLETSMYSLVGNGQPGLIAKLQEDVRDLQKWRWRMVGIVTGVATVMSGIVTTIGLLLKK
jgi:hypothetical protein